MRVRVGEKEPPDRGAVSEPVKPPRTLMVSLPHAARLLIGLGFAAGIALPTNAFLTETERTSYRGWKGCYRICNAGYELIFVPQIGRIMRYGRIGGTNVLWENPELAGKVVPPDEQTDKWINYGGDKLWPAPQDRWGWPPDSTLDRGACRVEFLGPRRMLVTGKVSPQLGLRFSREIALEKSGSEVSIRNTLTNASEKPVEWSIWEVAQVDNPREAWLPLARKSRFPEGYFLFPKNPPTPETLRVEKYRVVLSRDPKRGGKIGTDSTQGWAAAQVESGRFRISAAYEGGAYPDEGCVQELWSNPDPNRYMELELLGPIRKIAPGQSTHFTTRWDLRSL